MQQYIYIYTHFTYCKYNHPIIIIIIIIIIDIIIILKLYTLIIGVTTLSHSITSITNYIIYGYNFLEWSFPLDTGSSERRTCGFYSWLGKCSF